MKIKKSKDFKKWKIEHNKTLLWIILILIAVLIFVIFKLKYYSDLEKDANNTLNDTENNVSMANPASVYCTENNGTLEIRTDSTGGQWGVCIFDDGSECEEWKFFRAECKPGDSLI